jgi:hypothetical protein
MKRLSLLLSIVLVTTAPAQSLRLILVPQQILVSRGASPKKFDLFLYNAGKSAQTVPSLESFRAFYVVRQRTNSDERPGSELRVFSQTIKDHMLKAGRVDHTVIDIDLSLEEGDYVELRVEIGHEASALTSNSVLLLCSPINSPSAEPASSPKATVTPSG